MQLLVCAAACERQHMQTGVSFGVKDTVAGAHNVVGHPQTFELDSKGCLLQVPHLLVV